VPRFRLGILLLLFAVPAAAAPQLRSIRIDPAGDDGLWRVTYHFARPVSQIEFQRQGRFQRTGWREETTSSKPRKKITIAFPVDFTHPEKDYQLFQRYSDGSVLLYTGHFNLEGVKSPRFELRARRGEHLIVGGRVFPKRATWTDVKGEGTFVYFGTLKPIETQNMIAVIDPAVPEWLEQRLGDGVPRLFADYTRLTGFKLEKRPTVFFSFEAAKDPNSTTWKGGTLPGVIQLHIEAPAGAKEDRLLLERFFKFLAHEAAHMWNGELFRSPDRNQSWIDEGGADAFAWRAMHRAGLLDDRALDARQAGDLNQCLAGIGSAGLDDAESQGNFRAVYTCGSALAWLTEASVRRADPSADLHTFWSALFRAAEARDRAYDESVYFAVLKARGDAATLQFIEDFVRRPMPDRLDRTIAAFRSVGVVLEPRPAEMPVDQKQSWAQSALAAVMSGDCGGRFSIARRSGKMVMAGNDQCATLKSEVAVAAVDEHNVSREGELVYDAIAARCAAKQPVTLNGLDVPCSATLEPRTPWLGVRR
jgi:hypothetical protein